MVEQTVETQVAEVTTLFDQVSQQLNHGSLPRWLELDLTFQQMRVLYMLKLRGPLKMSELSGLLKVSMPTITGIVSRLIERKEGPALVTRTTSPEDRRQVWAHLTSDGLNVTEQLEDFKQEALSKALDKLSTKDIEEIRHSLSLLYSALNQPKVNSELDNHIN